MISNVLGVIAAPPPVSEKHAPPAPAAASTAPAPPRSFASLLQRSRGEAPPPAPARDAPPGVEPAEPAEPVASEAAAEPNPGAPPRPRQAARSSAGKGSSARLDIGTAERSTDARRTALGRDDAEPATDAPTTAPWLPPPSARAQAEQAAANERMRTARAAAPAASAASVASAASTPAPSAELAASPGHDNAAAAPADAPAAVFTIATAPAPAAPVGAGAEAATVAAPVGTPAFAEALGVQVSVLVAAGVQRAELHLNPAEMGPVSVQIVVDGAQARVDFGADLAATRQAIEASLPALASALQDAGMTLHGGGVSQHARDRNEAETRAGQGTGEGRHRFAADEPHSPAAPTRRVAIAGGIDLYA